MKIHPECFPCIFERAKFECDLAFKDDEKGKLKALIEISRFAAQTIDENTVPALIGTERGRIISRVSGIGDPYAYLKKESNKAGKQVLGVAREYYKASDDKILALMRIAAAANSMEYGVRGHEFNEVRFKNEFSSILNENCYGDFEKVKEAIQKFTHILYLLDNAGEAVVDGFVIKELEKLGKKVLASPKSEAVINDITKAEFIELGFSSENVIPSGAYVGVSLPEAPQEFLDLLYNPDYLIIAKGMGNYETLSEIEEEFMGRLIYVFRAKCLSVAESCGVKQGTLVIDIV